MLNFPVPYTEELLYSTIARAGIRHGLASPKQLLDEVFGLRGVIATLDLPSHLELVSRWLPKKFCTENLAYCHTLFALYAPFVPEERRQQCMAWMAGESQGAIHLALGIAASRIKMPRFIRYCPACVQEQRARQGEYYWRREWQVAGVETCLDHGALIDTPLPRTAMERHRFVAAAPECCPQVYQHRGHVTSDWVCHQVRLLLLRSAEQSSSFSQWSQYYQGLVRQHGLCRGSKQVDHQAVREHILQVWPADWLSRYQLLPNRSGDSESGWLRAIFRKHRKSFNYLQHIIVHQALLGDAWSICDVLDRVSRYPSEEQHSKVPVCVNQDRGTSIDQAAWLRLLMEQSPKKARAASPALYARLYRNHHDWLLEVNRRHVDKRDSSRLQRVDWQRRDQEGLQKLRQLKVFLSSNESSPRRSRNCYLKLLGNPSTIGKNLYRMPRSRRFLEEHVESVADHQVRRLQNAYECLAIEFDFPPRWRLLREARLSDERLTAEAGRYLDQLVNTDDENQGCRGKQ